MDFSSIIEGFLPNADGVTKTMFVVFIAIVIWLFNQIKKQFDEDDQKKGERANLALLPLGQLLMALKKDKVNIDDIQEHFTNILPYLEYDLYKEISTELEKDTVNFKIIESKVNNIISTLILKYSHQNEVSKSSFLFQMEGLIRPIKNIIKSLLVTFSIILIIAYFFMLHSFFNVFLSIINFSVTLITLLLIVGVLELFYKKKFKINLKNIILVLSIIGITVTCVIFRDMWLLTISYSTYVMSLFILFRRIRASSPNALNMD
jgi:hypothetical protein